TTPTPHPNPTPTPTPFSFPSPTPPRDPPSFPTRRSSDLTPVPLAGRIEAENFDNGGDGIAYHDVDSTNKGGLYRATTVDVEAAGSEEHTSELQSPYAGECRIYTDKIATAGSFNGTMRVTS